MKLHSYSIRKRLFLITCLIFLSFTAIILICNYYFTSLLRKNAYSSIVNTLEIYDKQLTDDLKALETYLFEINENNIDVSLLNNQYTPEMSLNIVRIKSLLSNSLPSFTQADGLFTFSASNDVFITRYKEPENFAYANFLKENLRTANHSDQLKELDIIRWFAQKWDDSYHLLRIIRLGNSYIGGWANLDNLTAPFRELTGYEANVFYVDDKGIPLMSGEQNKNVYDPSTMEGRYSLYKKRDGTQYISAAVSLDYCDYFLIALIPLKEINHQLISLYRILLFLAGAIVILTPTALFFLNRLWTAPLDRLRSVISTLHSGSYNAHISLENVHCQEFMNIYNTFNDMVEEIHRLRIDVYEEKIARSEYELQTLKSQLAPHFLINCLYSVSTLASTDGKSTIIRDMISHLTGHLRYSLSNRTYVSLEEEIRFVENYINLAEIRAPNSIRYSIDIDRDVKSAAVFPMLLLLFTENTIKYNLIVGELLAIEIKVVKEMKSGKPVIHLIHKDSGDGFSAETLSKLSDLTKKPEHMNWEGHIGLHNVIKRLKIVYGGKAEISFSNIAEGKGACIDMIIPYNTITELDMKEKEEQ